MKILHILAQLPSRTGSGVYFSNLIEGLKPYGHDQAALFATSDGFEFEVLDAASCFPVEFKSEALPFPIVGMSDVMPYESTVYSQMTSEMIDMWVFAFTKRLHEARETFKPDVVILHHLWMLTSIACEIFDDCLRIGVCHNTDIRQAHQHPNMQAAYVKNLHMLQMVYSLSAHQIDEIVHTFPISPSIVTAMGGGFNQNVFYPPEPRLPLKSEDDIAHLVYAAKIEQSKGIFELVRAFKSISETVPKLHLNIIGTPIGENERLLNELISGCDNISVIKVTSQKVLADIVRTKDIFVMPSYFEGLGLVAIECLASGLRVVSTEIEALQTLLGDKVNNSGVIEYVPLPRIYDTDKPLKEDIPAFIENLKDKLLVQINAVKSGIPIPDYVLQEIDTHSWSSISKNIHLSIMKYIGA